MAAVRHTFHNFLTIGFNAVASLVVTALVARWLTPVGMGTYSLVMWFFTIAGILINLGTVTTTMKYLATALGAGDEEEAAGVLRFGVRQVLVNGAVVSGLWLLATPLVERAYGGGGHAHLGLYMAVAAVALVPQALMALLTAAVQGLQRYDRVARATGVYAGCLLAGSAAALGLGLGIPGVLGVNALAAVLACLLYFQALAWWLPGWHKATLSAARRGKLRRYGGALMVLILLDAIVWQRSGVFFLGLWAPAQEVAFYALAFGLATMAMRMIPGTLVGLLIPGMSRAFGSGDMAEVAAIYRTAGRWMAILALPVAVGGAALAPALVAVMYGSAYMAVVPLLAVLFAAGALVMTFGFPASSVLYAVEGQRHLVRVGLGVAVVNLVLAVLLIPPFGALGAAWATAVAQVMSLPFGARFAARELGGVWPSLRRFPATLAAALVMGVPVWGLGQVLPAGLALLAGLPVGGLVYATALWLFRALEPEDVTRIRAVATKLPGVKRLLPAPGASPAGGAL